MIVNDSVSIMLSFRGSHGRTVLGTLRSRLLVNAVVDPDEAATRLPPGLRPHVTSAGTVVGCCLLEIEHLRPGGLPRAVGLSQRAAAHRISVAWVDATGELVVGVYVPERRTDSRLAVALGGRWFPGVHRPARVESTSSEDGLSWSVNGDAFGITMRASVADDSSADLTCEPIGGTCIGATIGLSLDHRGALEGARMEPSRRDARAVDIHSLDSTFISSFATAEPAPSYLMQHVDVRWNRAAAPPVLRQSVE